MLLSIRGYERRAGFVQEGVTSPLDPLSERRGDFAGCSPSSRSLLERGWGEVRLRGIEGIRVTDRF
jgi:hypothetical protein